MTRNEPPPSAGRNESELERWDRNLSELLQELRVAQTGVQILFAFLLTVAFSNRFARTDPMQKWVYVTTLLVTACATALLIAPVSYHRLFFRRGHKPEVVRAANRFAVSGLVFLLLAIVGTILLAVDAVAGATLAIVCAAVAAVVYTALWYALPLRRRIR